jgi:cytochrome c553
MLYHSIKKPFVLLSSLSVFSFLTFVANAQDISVRAINAGAKKAAMCIGCHGIVDYKTAFPRVYRVPKIAGQSATYLENSLKAYANGERKHPSMQAIAKSLTDEDMADLSAYYAYLGTSVSTPEEVKNQDVQASIQAQSLLQAANCTVCHGVNFNQGIDPSYPKLAGQYEDYLYAALEAYWIGDKKGTWGRNNAIMNSTLKAAQSSLGLNDIAFKKQMKAVAKYLGRLPESQVYVVPQSRFVGP